MGRVATSRSPSRTSAVESAASPVPRRAPSRASSSRCRAVTAPRMAFGDSLAASSATTGVHTSPRYGAKAGFSRSHTRLAPHSASSLRPASVAVSVSHTASAWPPAWAASREASPSTSAVTFFGLPCLSSSTMPQNAPAMSVVSWELDCLGFFAEGAHQLARGLGRLPGDDPPRRPRRQRLERHHRQGGRLDGKPEGRSLHVLPLLLLRPP